MAELSDAELCLRFRRLYVAAVCDAMYELGLPEPVLPGRLRPLLSQTRMVGLAFTIEGQAIDPPVSWEEGLERLGPYLGVFERMTPDTVIVSVNGPSPVSQLGELTAGSARAHGCVGAVVDGNLRDIEGLRQLGFQVFYRDVSPLSAIGRWEMAAFQRPVIMGDIVVNPGDVIFGEFEGIVVIPHHQAQRVLEKAEEVVDAEAVVRAEVSRGVSPLDSLSRHGHI